MCHNRLLSTVVLTAVWGCSVTPVEAGGRHGHSGWYGGGRYSGSYSGSSSYSGSYSYNNPYYNPYSYESQSLPYWLKPSNRSTSGGYSYSVPAQRSDRYGAIAYSRTTGASGYSYSQYSQADAEREALQQCDATDGEIIGWMRNSHGALAVGDDVNEYGWAWGTTADAAQEAALAKCHERTTNCRIAVTVFSGN